MTAPAVSVLVTTFGHERWVCEALDSLAAQTFDDFEVIIIDDHSNDKTVEVIREWLRRNDLPAQLIVNDRNMGIAAVMNAGLRVAQGEFVSGLSGDDCMKPRLLELQHAGLSSYADDVAGVLSDMRLIDSRGNELAPSWLETVDALPPPAGAALFRRLLTSKWNFLPSPAMMVKRSALDAVGPYDETLIFEDYDMWLRLVDRYELRFVPGTLVDYRLHPDNFSRRPDREFDFLIDVGRVQSKWRGRQSDVDWTNARRIWSQGHEIMSQDAISGRRLFELAEELVPTPAAALALELDWRRERGALEHAAEREQHAAAEREHAAEYEQHARTTHEAAIQVERLVERVDGQARGIEQLLDSRWLRLLEVFERPVRRIRPGLGTVRERLRQLGDQLEH